jgi:hypothetical protein
MFLSPCTLRSASCAALIALATAAGIARVPEATAQAPTPQPVVIAVATARHTCASEPRVVRRPQPAVTPALPSPRAARQLAAPPDQSRPRCSSPYQLPFAVGPPAP